MSRGCEGAIVSKSSEGEGGGQRDRGELDLADGGDACVCKELGCEGFKKGEEGG